MCVCLVSVCVCVCVVKNNLVRLWIGKGERVNIDQWGRSMFTSSETLKEADSFDVKTQSETFRRHAWRHTNPRGGGARAWIDDKRRKNQSHISVLFYRGVPTDLVINFLFLYGRFLTKMLGKAQLLGICLFDNSLFIIFGMIKIPCVSEAADRSYGNNLEK